MLSLGQGRQRQESRTAARANAARRRSATHSSLSASSRRSARIDAGCPARHNGSNGSHSASSHGRGDDGGDAPPSTGHDPARLPRDRGDTTVGTGDGRVFWGWTKGRRRLLLKDLRDISGQPYRQNKKWGKCTYLDQAIRSARSVLNKNSLLGKYPKYPLLFYHADWRDEDKTKLETAVGLNMNDGKYKSWWHPVVFGPDALPPYLYNVNATVSGWQQLHVDGDLRRETRNNIHGFGYMLMCRFYAGLIHHAPLDAKIGLLFEN